jgi:phage terminase large subunit-like protein
MARKYAEAVVAGTVPACSWVRFACERQLRDIERSWEWRYDTGEAARVCRFIEELPHIKGRWEQPKIKLQPWQCFMLCSLFGWVNADGVRRFRKALVVIPRKNGKSVIAAGVALYCLILDSEPGAEVYSAATTRDQAKICWDTARRMVERLPRLREVYGVAALAHSITIESTASAFKPLSRDADSLEGLNIHAAIIDELHAHGTREVFDVMDEATGARRSPLLFIISTEGDAHAGVFVDQVDYLHKVLDGRLENERYFGVYYGLDASDDWTHPSAWRKANPNLDISVLDMPARFAEAKHSPASQASFMTKRLNVRVGASEAFFNMLAWSSLCLDKTLKLADFDGQDCISAFDLASKRDLSSRVLMFRHGDGYAVFGAHYLPEAAIEPGNPNYDVYRGWSRDGHLVITTGNVTDYGYIEDQILVDAKRFRMVRVGYDPFQATQLVTRLQAAGLGQQQIVEVPQTVRSMSEPMKELDALVVSGKIRHNGDPVLTWAMANTAARSDAKENVYPRKARDENKIDPAVALIMALSLWMRSGSARQSVYSNAATAII